MPKVSKLVYFEKKKNTLHLFSSDDSAQETKLFSMGGQFLLLQTIYKFVMWNRLSSKHLGRRKDNIVHSCSVSKYTKPPGLQQYLLYQARKLIKFTDFLGGRNAATIVIQQGSLHCNENPIYVFLIWELRGLSPNFHIRMCLWALYTVYFQNRPTYFRQRNRQADHGNT